TLVVVSGLLVGALDLGAGGAAMAYAISWIAAAAVCLLALKPTLSDTPLRAASRRLLVLGLPVAPAGVAIWLYSLVDRFFVGYYSGTIDLGLYAASARL